MFNSIRICDHEYSDVNLQSYLSEIVSVLNVIGSFMQFIVCNPRYEGTAFVSEKGKDKVNEQ